MDSLIDLLTCDICGSSYDQWDRLPKVLPCGHTLCAFCLRDLQRASVHPFACPTCHRPVAFHGGSTNCALLEILEVVAASQERARKAKLVARIVPRTASLPAERPGESTTSSYDLSKESFAVRKVFFKISKFVVAFKGCVFENSRKINDMVGEGQKEVRRLASAYDDAANYSMKEAAVKELSQYINTYTKTLIEEFIQQYKGPNKSKPITKYEMQLIEDGDWRAWMCLGGALRQIFPQTAETVRDFIKKAKVLLQKKKEKPDRWTRRLDVCIEEAKVFVREMTDQLSEEEAGLAAEVNSAFEEFSSLVN